MVRTRTLLKVRLFLNMAFLAWLGLTLDLPRLSPKLQVTCISGRLPHNWPKHLLRNHHLAAWNKTTMSRTEAQVSPDGPKPPFQHIFCHWKVCPCFKLQISFMLIPSKRMRNWKGCEQLLISKEYILQNLRWSNNTKLALQHSWCFPQVRINYTIKYFSKEPRDQSQGLSTPT